MMTMTMMTMMSMMRMLVLMAGGAEDDEDMEEDEDDEASENDDDENENEEEDDDEGDEDDDLNENDEEERVAPDGKLSVFLRLACPSLTSPKSGSASSPPPSSPAVLFRSNITNSVSFINPSSTAASNRCRSLIAAHQQADEKNHNGNGTVNNHEPHIQDNSGQVVNGAAAQHCHLTIGRFF